MLRGGAGEAAGLAPGDELIAAGDWRLRRLDDALRTLPLAGETTLLVGRDQRVVALPLAVDRSRRRRRRRAAAAPSTTRPTPPRVACARHGSPAERARRLRRARRAAAVASRGPV